MDHPQIIAVIGEKGGGKTATSHYLLESRFHGKGIECSMDASNKLKAKQPKNLPPWLHLHGRMIPPKNAVLIDDAGITLESYEWQKLKRIKQIAELSRHRDATIIYNTQLEILVIKGMRGLVDTKIFKRPQLGAEDEERQGSRAVKKLIAKFDEMEEKNPDEDLRAYSYVISNKPRWEGWVGPTPLPTYWSDELSKW